MMNLFQSAAEMGAYGASIAMAIYGVTVSAVATTAVLARSAARRRAALRVLRALTRSCHDRNDDQ